MMLNILTIDLEDYFQVENFAGIIKFSEWDKYESRVERNTDTLLEILSVADVKVTFFVLGWIAEKFPELVKKVHSAGHEIACHSYNHQLVFRQKPEEFRQDLKKTKGIIEGIIQDKIIGYRAPTFSINANAEWAFDILAEEGFKYDSSFSPARFKFRCNMESFSPYKINTSNGRLWEFPVFSGGGYFRLSPYGLIKRKIERLNKAGYPAVIYLHPWEIDSGQPRIKSGPISNFRHYVNISKNENKIKRLLSDFPFAPIKDNLKLDGEPAAAVVGLYKFAARRQEAGW